MAVYGINPNQHACPLGINRIKPKHYKVLLRNSLPSKELQQQYQTPIQIGGAKRTKNKRVTYT
jgi:hypothetical protein